MSNYTENLKELYSKHCDLYLPSSISTWLYLPVIIEIILIHPWTDLCSFPWFSNYLKIKYKLLYMVQHKKATAFPLAYPKLCLLSLPTFVFCHFVSFLVFLNPIPVNHLGLKCYFLRKLSWSCAELGHRSLPLFPLHCTHHNYIELFM